MKAKLNYTVRTTRAPGETNSTIVPVIVERLSPTSLADVVENCIDRGLIAGLKPTAAEGIADGIARQIAREFSLGRGVKFGNYFYGRPYLSGTVAPNGRLNSDNSINVRLYKGEAFKLSTSDFTLTFDGAGDSVKVDFLFSDLDGAGGNTRGTLVTGAPVIVQGRSLYAAGDTNKVTFDEVNGTGSVEVTEFLNQGDGLLKFAWPTGLEAGKRYAVTVERTDVNGVTRVAKGRYVEVVAGATPTDPTVTAINDGTFRAGDGNVVTGTNMRFASEYPCAHVVIKDSSGTDMEAMISDDTSVPRSETRFAIAIDEGTPFTDGEEYTFEFEMLDADDDPVTVTHTARWQAK